MKTAISIPDHVFEAAEKLAKGMSISRSKLYTLAIQEYLQTHQEEQITKQLDAIYSEENSTLDPFFMQLQVHSLLKDNDNETR